MKRVTLRALDGHLRAAWRTLSVPIASVVCTTLATVCPAEEPWVVFNNANFPCRTWSIRFTPHCHVYGFAVNEIGSDAGDIDGDGYHDFIFFLSGYSFPERDGPKVREADNAIVVEYGGPDRQGTITTVRRGQVSPDETHLAEFNHDDDLPILGGPGNPYAVPISKLGSVIACDDFDKDGLDDIVFSANSRDASKKITELCVYYGDAAARGKKLYFEDSQDCPDLTRLLLDDPALGSDTSHLSGVADVADVAYSWGFGDLCTGDFNADTFPDIAIVAYRNWRAPMVFVIYGGEGLRGTTRALSVPGDLSTTRVLCQSKRYLDEQALLAGFPIQRYSGPFVRLASGDLNGDGIDDLVVGDRTADPDGVDVETPWTLYETWPWDDIWIGQPISNTGAAYIVYGSPSLPGTVVDLESPVPESGESIIEGEGFPNLAGFSLATGDMNQDGYDDLAVGGLSDWHWIENQGAYMYLFHGANSKPGIPWGNGTLVALNTSFAAIGAWGETRIAYRRVGHYPFATGIAFGDASGDGRDDLVHHGYRRTDRPWWEGDTSSVFLAVATPEIGPGQRAFPAGLIDGQLLGPRCPENGCPLDGSILCGGGYVNFAPLPSQDIDGDGAMDVVDKTHGVAGRQVASAMTAYFGDASAPTATAVERYRSGKTALRGFGGRLSPVLRAYAGFEDGGASSAAVTLNKSSAGIANFPDGYTAPIDCWWRVQTDRVGFTQANLAFRYIEDDLLWPLEVPLVLFTAPDLGGPWTPVANQQLDTHGRRIYAQVSELGYFTMAAEPGADTSPDPSVETIACDTCGEAADAAGEDVMTVTFSRAVTGVDESDFYVTAPSTIGAGILGVEGGGRRYRVRVALGAGVGPAHFEVLDDDTIRDARDFPLGGPGAGNGGAERVTCANALPVLVESMTPDHPSPTSLPRVSYTVTFTTPVTGVDIEDFTVEAEDVQRAFIESAGGSGAVYTVWVRTGVGPGQLRLKLRDNDTIVDPGEGPLGGPGTGNGDFAGPSYTMEREIDRVPPAVQSITRASVNPTSAASVDFYVWFSEEVEGVDMSDLEVVATGGIFDAQVTGIRGGGELSIVTVSTGSGDGGIQLRLFDNDTIADLSGNPLGGAGAGNGDFVNGAVYTVYKSDPTAVPPVVESIACMDQNPTSLFTVRYRVRFSTYVTGVDVDDFVTTVDGLTGTSVAAVSGLGDEYVVRVNTGNGAGMLRLDVRDNDTIRDAVQNPLGGIGTDNGHFTLGVTYQVVRDPELKVRALKENTGAAPGGTLKIVWTSGPIGPKVRIELRRDGQRVAVLAKSTANDGSQNVTIPAGVAKGSGYTIRVVSTANPAYFTEMKKTFAIE